MEYGPSPRVWGERAKYGGRLIESLATDLAAEEIKGLGDPRVLRDCRVLYRTYPQIRGTVSREMDRLDVPAIEAKATSKAIRGTVTRELPDAVPPEELLRLSWSKLQELMRLEDPWKRAFYELSWGMCFRLCSTCMRTTAFQTLKTPPSWNFHPLPPWAPRPSSAA
jgi:hypothetical protein